MECTTCIWLTIFSWDIRWRPGIFSVEVYYCIEKVLPYRHLYSFITIYKPVFGTSFRIFVVRLIVSRDEKVTLRDRKTWRVFTCHRDKRVAHLQRPAFENLHQIVRKFKPVFLRFLQKTENQKKSNGLNKTKENVRSLWYKVTFYF